MTREGSADRRRQRQKNIAVGVALAVLCLLFYLITVVKITGNLP